MVNLAFYYDKGLLVHWTHSFLYFYNTSGLSFFQDGIVPKKFGPFLCT